MTGRINNDGRVTIPRELRMRLGFTPGVEVTFELLDDAVRVSRVRERAARKSGQEVVEELRGCGDVAMTADEILALTRG